MFKTEYLKDLKPWAVKAPRINPLPLGSSFYEYDQNNPGGSFDIDMNVGIGHVVIVEARNATEANHKAISLGVYFNGDGDCPCCGDRWYEHPATSAGEKFEDLAVSSLSDEKKIVFVHYLDGTVTQYEV